MSEIQKTLNDRNSKYGDFTHQADISQRMKDAAKSGRSWNTMPHYQKEGIEMILHKIARMVNGDPLYLDTVHDIIGYAKLIEDRHAEKVGEQH